MSSRTVSRETETTRPSRYILPKDLDTAIGQLEDQELDRLVLAALEERVSTQKNLLSLKKPTGSDYPKPTPVRCLWESWTRCGQHSKRVLRQRGLPESSEFRDQTSRGRWRVKQRNSELLYSCS